MKIKNMSNNFLTTSVAIIVCIVLVATSFLSAATTQEYDASETETLHEYNDEDKSIESIIEQHKLGNDIDQSSFFLSRDEYGMESPNMPLFVPGKILVKFTSDVTVEKNTLQTNVPGINDVNREFNVKTIENVFKNNTKREGTPNLSNIYELTFDATKPSDTLAFITKLQEDPQIVYAEPNYLAYTTYVPNDPRISEQWALENIQAFDGWDIEQGDSDVVIAIIDTGVDYTHDDLQENMHPVMYDFVEINIYDYLLAGFSLVDGEDYTNEDNDPMDFNGHGTHCAGIAAARGDNGVGVSGVCPYGSIMAVRAGFSIIHPSYGEVGLFESDDIAQAIVFATDNDADVISMSFGGSQISSTVYDAISYAHDHNVTLVAATGNSNSITKSYPAGYDEVVAVAATAQDDSKARYSNYGSWVDIAAPGGDNSIDTMILSTVPTAGGILSDPSGYRFLQGTSMACPHVAGLAGLIMSKNPAWSSGRVISQIIASTDYFEFYGEGMGTGRVNAYQALNSTYDETRIDLYGFSINESVGNGNGNADAGEEIEVVVTLKNYFGVSYGVEATIRTNDPYIRMINTTAHFDDLFYWDFTNNSNEPFVFEISSDCPHMYAIEFIINITANNETYETQDIFEIPVSLYVPGWPVTLDSPAETHPVVGDIDGDGDIEVVVGSDYSIYALHGNGSLVEGWPQTHSPTWTSPALGDVDNDGKLEVVRTSFKEVYVWYCNGTLLPDFPVYVGEFNVFLSQVSLADLDEDHDLEILFAKSDGNVYALHHNGSVVEGWPVSVNSSTISTQMCPAVGDITGDDSPDVIVGTYPGEPPCEVYAFHHNGTLIDGWPVSLNGHIASSASLGDINNDGTLEIFVGIGYGYIYGFYGNGTVIDGWPRFYPPRLSSLTVLGDLDGDDDIEIIHSRYRYRFAHHHNGTRVSGWPCLGGSTMYWDAQIADIDNDGDMEVIARDNSNRIYAWHHNGDPVENYPITVGIETPGEWGIESSLAFADIDGDGTIDMVTGSDFSDANIYAYDLPTINNPESIEWGMYRNNMQHTGVYSKMLENADLIISEFSAEYLSETTLTLTATIKNSGNVDITTPFQVSFYGGTADNDPQIIDSIEIPGLKLGETTNATIYWEPQPEIRVLSVFADSTNVIEEVDERNNGASITMSYLLWKSLQETIDEFTQLSQQYDIPSGEKVVMLAWEALTAGAFTNPQEYVQRMSKIAEFEKEVGIELEGQIPNSLLLQKYQKTVIYLITVIDELMNDPISPDFWDDAEAVAEIQLQVCGIVMQMLHSLHS